MNNRMIFNEVTNMRLLLHNNVYNNNEVMNELFSDLSGSFSLFNIEYDAIRKIIQLKIKKTNMKKVENSELLNYYYKVLNAIFVQFFIKKYNVISSLILQQKDEYNLRGEEINYLSDSNIISNFYNITIISDNIIMIHL